MDIIRYVSKSFQQFCQTVKALPSSRTLEGLVLYNNRKNIAGLLILLITFHFTNAQPYIVHIVPIGKVSEEHVRLVKSSVQDYYNTKTYLHDSIEVSPEFITKFDTILNVNAINMYLHQQSNDSSQKWIGVTDWHITIGNVMPMLIRGFTEGVGGNCAVVSSAKVLSEAKVDSIHTFQELYSRVVKHEFGHLTGLEHCPNSKCLMTFGTSFLEIDGELCRNKLPAKSLKIQ